MANIRFLDQVSLASFQGSNAEGGNTGSLLLTASAVLNDITFTKGNGDTFIVTIDTGSDSTNTGSLLTTGSFSDPILTFTKGDNSTFDINISAITSSLVTTGSVLGNTLTFTKGNGDTFELTVDTGSGGGGSIDTGSFYISSSVVNNIITFTQGDGTTETITVDTGSAVFVDTGSFYTSSSVDLNTITFTQGDGTTESVTIDTGSSSTDTGSLLTTASAANNDITFTKGDGSTFVVTVDTGSGGGGLQDLQSVLTQGSTSTGSQVVLDYNSGNPLQLKQGLDFRGRSNNVSASITLDNAGFLRFNIGSANNVAVFNDGRGLDISQLTGSGDVRFSSLTSQSQPNIIGIDAEGDLTYFSTSSLSGGSQDLQSVLDQGNIASTNINLSGGLGSVGSPVLRFYNGSDFGDEIELNVNTIGDLVVSNRSQQLINLGSTSGSLQGRSLFLTPITASVGVQFNNLPSQSQPNIIGRDSNGNLTYFSTSSLSGGSQDLQSVLDQGNIASTNINLSGGLGNVGSPALSFYNGSNYGDIVRFSVDVSGDLVISNETQQIINLGDKGGRTLFLTPITASTGVRFSSLTNQSQPNIIGRDGDGNLTYFSTSSITDDLLTTGSVANNILTFTKGDGTTFDLTVDTFSGSTYYSGSLIPEATIAGNGLWTLGSATHPWKELFVTTASINFIQDGSTVATLNGEEDGIRIGNVLITTESLAFVDSTGSVVSTIAAAQYSGSEPISGQLSETGSLLVTGSVSNNTLTFEKGDGTTFDLTVDTGSGGDVSFNGDRIISQDLFPTMFSASFNPGTSGSISDFLNAIFFPNNPPVITANTFSIDEFQPSGSTVGTVTATDPEGQSLTFTTQSSYTDDFFRINSSSGVITANALVTSSINTDTSQGYSASLFPITVTDTFGSETNGNVYIRVIANQAPVFREDSVSGNIISSFTSSLNENSTSGSKAQIYYTDAESDTITIETGSGVLPSGSFELQISGTFVRLVQTTGSLDYEGITQYTYVLTASDEHYPSEDDNSISYLPAIIDVVDNIAPTVNNQTLTGVTESSAGGTSAGTISVTEPEGDVVTFTNFSLISLALDGTPVSTGSYTGTGQSDPTEDAFQVDSSGVVSRRSSVFINSDLINSYVYRVSVRDNFNETTSSGEITIPIGDDQAPSLNGVQAFYLIESAVSGANVYDSVNGRSGTTSRFTSNQSVTWTVSSSVDFGVDTNGYLTIAKNISGSSIISGDTISGEITASNSFGTTNQSSFTVNITENFPATGSFTNQSGDWNTNEATLGTNLVSVTITDPESDTPYSMSLSGTGASDLVAVPQNVNSSSYQIQATSDLTAGDYGYTASIVDNFNKSQSYERTITISQAGNGVITTNGTFYVIESATSSSLIYTSGSGYSGTQADLGVSYSPNYGDQFVQSFTSSNAQIAVTTAGALSLNQNISGSGTGSGDTITSDITFRDQYNNIGSGSITINVSLNLPPDSTLNLGDSSLLTSSYAVSGSVIASLTGSDVQELDNIVSATLTGTDAGKFELQNASEVSTTRRYEIQPTASLETGTYSITGSVTDSFGKTGLANLDITIVDAPAIPEVYIYASTRGQAAPLPSQYDAVLGTTETDGSPLAEWASGSLGNEGPITLSGGTMRLIGSASAGAGGSNLNTLISSTIGAVNPTENEAGNHLIYIVYPSGSDDPRLTGVPTSTTDAFGGSTQGEYVLYYYSDSVDKGIVGSQLDHFTISTGYTASNGDIKTDYTNWTVLGCNNSKFSSTSTIFYSVPSSGSAPA